MWLLMLTGTEGEVLCIVLVIQVFVYYPFRLYSFTQSDCRESEFYILRI